MRIKKLLAILLSLTVTLTFSLNISACATQQINHSNEDITSNPVDDNKPNDTPDDEEQSDEHVHDFSDTWSFDAENHWRAAICGHDEKEDFGSHVIKDDTCTICGCIIAGTDGLSYTLDTAGNCYTVSGIGTATVTDIIIPSFYNNLPVTSIGLSAFSGCESLTSITIPNSIDSISYHAFYGCDSLEYHKYDNALYLGNESNPYMVLVKAINTDITDCEIENKTIIINYDAFMYCDSLRDITIPNSVTSIGINAFFGCRSLANINIPDNVTFIGDLAFNDCASLEYYNYDNALYLGNESNPYMALIKAINTDITDCKISNETKLICSYAFNGCKSLTSVTIGNGINSINNYAFFNCASLESLVIPDSVTSIGGWTFYGCSSLKKITIPFNVASIGENAFAYCTSLENIQVASENTVYHSEGNCIIETKSKTLIIGCKNSIIPSDGSVIAIGNGAFGGCYSLTDITLPDSIDTIGEGSFFDCHSLTDITIPDGITSISWETFMGCNSLKSITIPASVSHIDLEAFSGCHSLEIVYYTSSKTDWEKIEIESKNEALLNAAIIYNYRT